MKKYFIFLILICLVFSGCNGGKREVKSEVEIAVNDIVINKSHAYVDKGDKIILLAQVFPFNSDNQKIHWKSDNPNVASVDDGIVVGKSEGRTVITAISDDGEFSDNCIVFVSSPKLDYEKYQNNLNFENQSIRENLNYNFITNFKSNRVNNIISNQINSFKESIKSIENLFNNVKLNYEIMSNNIFNKESKLNSFVSKYSLNKDNVSDNVDNSLIGEHKESENTINNENNVTENNDSNTNYIYSYQYFYNSNGLNEDIVEDENTIYKDENTIIKEKVSEFKI